MVCIRCQMVVKAELEKLGLRYLYVKIGEADIAGSMQPEQVEQLKAAGYEQAAATDAPEEAPTADEPALIYYQRNYKNAAKALRQVIDERYDNVSYRFELVQSANIVIVLGPQADSNTATSTAE